MLVPEITGIDSFDISIPRVTETDFDLDDLQHAIATTLTGFKSNVITGNLILYTIAFENRGYVSNSVNFKCFYYKGVRLVVGDYNAEDEHKTMMSGIDGNGNYFFTAGQNYRIGFGTESTLSVSGGTVQRTGGAGYSVNSPESYWTTYWGGLCGQTVNGTNGAAKILQQYGQYNISNTVGWPSAPPSGYKYVNIDVLTTKFEPNNTTITTNPFYSPTIMFGTNMALKRELHLPTQVFGFNAYQQAFLNSTKNYSTYKNTAPCLTSAMSNYYLGNITGSLFSRANVEANPTNSRVFLTFLLSMDVPENYVGQLAASCSYFWDPAYVPSSTFYPPEPNNSTCIKIGSYYVYRYTFGKRVLMHL